MRPVDRYTARRLARDILDGLAGMWDAFAHDPAWAALFAFVVFVLWAAALYGATH